MRNLEKEIYIEKRRTPKINKYLKDIANYEPDKKNIKDVQTNYIYENLITIKKELIGIDTFDLCNRLIPKTTELNREIEGRDILLFISEKDADKTTMIKALLGYKMGIKL
jgi:hypothetical protein